MHNGNTNLVQTILRDYSKSWDDFYNTFFPYFEKFYIALKTMEGLRITHEHIHHKGKYVVRIEYNDDWKEENLNMDLTLVRSTELKSFNDESRTIHPSDSISLLPMTIWNFCTSPLLEKPDSSKTKVLERARIQGTSSKPKLLAQELPPEDSNAKEPEMKAMCAKEENNGSNSEDEEVTENLLKSPDKVIEPSTSSQSYFDEFFETMKPTNVENNMEQNEMINKLKTEIGLEADFESKCANIRKDLEYEVTKLKNETKALHSQPVDAENDDEENEEFKKKLEEIKRKNKEEWEQKRRERAENRKKMDDELKDLPRQKQKQGLFMEDVKAEYVQDQLSNSHPVSIDNKKTESEQKIDIENAMSRMDCLTKQFCEESNVISCGSNNRPKIYEKCCVETLETDRSEGRKENQVVAPALSNGNDRKPRMDDECDVDSEGNQRKDHSNADCQWKSYCDRIWLYHKSSVAPENQVGETLKFHTEESVQPDRNKNDDTELGEDKIIHWKNSKETLDEVRFSENPSSTSSYRENQSSQNTSSRSRSSTNQDETQFSRIRSQMLSIYEDFENGDEFRYKFVEGRMTIVDRGRDSEIIEIWNRIVERITRFLAKKEFTVLVNSKLPEILKEFDQVANF